MPGQTPAFQRRRSASLRPGRRAGDLLGKSRVVLVFASPLSEEHLPPDQAEVVDKQNPIQVVDLMLNSPGLQSGGFLTIGPSFGIQRLEHNPVGSGDISVNLRNRQAALFGG